MKWLLFIFSVYVLTLSAVPCCGDDTCCEDEMILATGNHHQEHEHPNKPALPCSPFFSCNTCHGVVIPEISGMTPLVMPYWANIYYDYTQEQLPEFPTPVWQPPQLS